MKTKPCRSVAIPSVALLFLLQSPFADAVEPVRIVSVIKGDAFKVEYGGSEKLVLLYGVECPSTITRGGKQAKDFVIAQTKDDPLSIDVVEERSGLTYVVLRLHDGVLLLLELDSLETDVRDYGQSRRRRSHGRIEAYSKAVFVGG